MAPPLRRRRPPPPPEPLRISVLWLVVFAALLAVLVWVWLPPDAPRQLNHRLRALRRTAPTLVLVLVEAARPDRLGVCGATRPTSPTLDALVADGATLRCDAIAPATWTTPSVASLFTGTAVSEHGVDTRRTWAPDGRELRPRVRPLVPEATSLAERLLDAGYQTAIISENPLLTEGSGLLQGFVHRDVAPRFGGGRSTLVASALEGLLRDEVDPAAPLFLTVVLSGTREPLSPIPRGLDWLPARPATGCFGNAQPLCRAFFAGGLRSEEAAAFREALVDLYDHGLADDDRHLALLLDKLDAWGWRTSPWRLVVAGTSGIELAEGRRYGLGNDVSERLARVPLLVAGSGAPAELPPSVSALVATSLLESGTLPSPLPAALSFGNRTGPARPGHLDTAGDARAAARWDGTEKTTWRDGVVTRVDLATDPGEENPTVIDASAAPDLTAAVEAWLDVAGRRPDARLFVLPPDVPAPSTAAP